MTPKTCPCGCGAPLAATVDGILEVSEAGEHRVRIVLNMADGERREIVSKRLYASAKEAEASLKKKLEELRKTMSAVGYSVGDVKDRFAGPERRPADAVLH